MLGNGCFGAEAEVAVGLYKDIGLEHSIVIEYNGVKEETLRCGGNVCGADIVAKQFEMLWCGGGCDDFVFLEVFYQTKAALFGLDSVENESRVGYDSILVEDKAAPSVVFQNRFVGAIKFYHLIVLVDKEVHRYGRDSIERCGF